MVSDYPDLLTLTYWSSGQQQETESTRENQSKKLIQPRALVDTFLFQNLCKPLIFRLLNLFKQLEGICIHFCICIQFCICIWYFVFADQNCSTYSSIWSWWWQECKECLTLWDRSNAMDSYCRITHEDNINVNQCKSM